MHGQQGLEQDARYTRTSQPERYAREENMILKIISLVLWLFTIVTVISYIPMSISSLNQSNPTGNPDEMSILFIVLLFIISMVEIFITIVIRHFALVRPAKRGTLKIDTLGGGIRFFLVHFLNWSFAESIAIYGMVLLFMYGKIWFLFVFCPISLGTLIFHAPRFKTYQTCDKCA